MLPYELQNIILSYKNQLEGDLVYIQYHLTSGREVYRINWESDRLIPIMAILMTRYLYPMYESCPVTRVQRGLYKGAILHYKALLGGL
jgi:hypothetical protein